MCKRLFLTAATTAAVLLGGASSKCQAQLISSFEGNLSSSLGATWEIPNSTAEFVPVGATDGTSALSMQHATNWTIQAILRGQMQLAQAAASHDFLVFDATTKDLGIAGDTWSPAWRQMFVIFNSNQGGWQQTQIDFSVAADDGGSLTTPIILDLAASGVKANAQTFVDAAASGPGIYWELFLAIQGGDQNIPVIKAGDYGPADSVINAADYVTWRENLNGTTLTNETVTPGIVDVADYDEWRANYGKDYTRIGTIIDNVRFANAGSGAGSAAPEPSSGILVVIGSMVVGLSRRLRK
jgi:hypothetical protein